MGAADEEPVDSDLDEESSDDDSFLKMVARAPVISTPPPPEPELERLAQFRILEKIGRGGMGVVYRAEDEKLERVVALKVLPSNFDDDKERRRRFLREAKLSASITHPNVATVYEVGEADGRIYIAMELVTGKTLRNLLEEGQLPIPDAIRITKDIARGTSEAHARGIAHRDLKPDNVMVTTDGKVKVLDFGLAKGTEDAPRAKTDKPETVTLTQEGRILGTPGYMSPEQATGRPVDVRTDVFSLGVILYELLTGARPFKGETPMDLVIATSRDEVVAPSKKNPRVSPALDEVLDRCMRKDPSERYATAAELLGVLESVDLSKKAPAPSRNGAKTIAIGVAAAAIAIVAFVKLGASSTPPITQDTAPASTPSATQTVAVNTTPTATAQATATTTPTATTTATSVPTTSAPIVRPAISVVRPVRPAPTAPASVASSPSPAPAPADSVPRVGVINQSPY